MSAQQLALYRLIRSGKTVKEAAIELGIAAKLASKQLAAVRKKAAFSPLTKTPLRTEDNTTLKRWQEEALTLVEGRGVSPGEAARRLGQLPATVRSLICRCRRKAGQTPRSKTATYRWEDKVYLPPPAHPGTGFGLRLANRRRQVGVTPEALAALAGITIDLLERIEIGEFLPDWRLGERICRQVGVEVADLVTPCGRVELERELLVNSGGMRAGKDRPERRPALRRLAAAGGTPVVMQGTTMRGKGGRFILHLDRVSRGRVGKVLADRRPALLEVTPEGGALYLTSSADVLAVREELGRWEDF